MDQGARRQTDFVPRRPDLIVTVGGCWRVVRDVQAEVDPCGRSHAALDGVRTAIEALAHHLTRQRGFLALAEPAATTSCPSAPDGTPWRPVDVPRLSTYPYVVVRIACASCRRRGSYRLARLADRFGAETPLVDVLAAVSADCAARGFGFKRHRGATLACGIMLPDLGSPTPPDVPPALAEPRLRIVGGRG